MCSSQPASTPTEDGTANIAGVEQAADESRSTGTDGSSKADILAYFKAKASNTPGTISEAIEVAAPGSNAEAYAIYQQALAQLYKDGGYAEQPQTVKVMDDGYRLCYAAEAPEDCAMFTNIELDGGKVADFDDGGESLVGRIALGNGESQELGDYGGGRATLSTQ